MKNKLNYHNLVTNNPNLEVEKRLAFLYNGFFRSFEGIDMLYLMRKQDESIIINNNIELKVVEVKGKYVKLGFDFPKGASVLRKELYDKIQQENKAASQNENLDILNSINLVSDSNDPKTSD